MCVCSYSCPHINCDDTQLSTKKVPFTIDLPFVFKSWDFLPKPLRSLEPYDKFLNKYLCCCKCFQTGSKISPTEKSELEIIQILSLQEKSHLETKF